MKSNRHSILVLVLGLLFSFGCKAEPLHSSPQPETRRHPITALGSIDPVSIWTAMIDKPVLTLKSAESAPPPLSAPLVAVLVAGKVVAGSVPPTLQLEKTSGTTFVVKTNNELVQQHYLLGYSR